MLAKADLFIIGFNISPKIITLAQARVKGNFSVADMLNYGIEGKGNFTGVMIFAHLLLSYADFHSTAYKYTSVLPPGGVLVLGQMLSDLCER